MTQRPHGARNRRTVPVPNSQKLEHSRRWHVVIAASLVHALHAASIYLAPAMLMSPMRHDLGLSVAEVALPLNVYRLVQALFLVPAGSVLDRVGPVRALRVSIVAAASLGLLFPLCTNLSQLVVLQALFAVTKLFGGLSAMLMVIARVFGTSAGMGTATSALLGGYSFAGFLVPSVVGSLYQRFGWRVCAGIVAALFACLGLPLTFCYLREDDQVAEMAGVQVERKKEDIHSSQISKSIVAQPSFSKPLFTPQYTYLASVIAAFSFSMHIVLDHFLVFLREDLAMSFEVGTKFISALNLLALVSKLAVGPLADNYDKGMLMLVFSFLGMLSSLLLFDVTAVGAFITTTSIYKVISFIPLCMYIFFVLRSCACHCQGHQLCLCTTNSSFGSDFGRVSGLLVRRDLFLMAITNVNDCFEFFWNFVVVKHSPNKNRCDRLRSRV